MKKMIKILTIALLFFIIGAIVPTSLFIGSQSNAGYIVKFFHRKVTVPVIGPGGPEQTGCYPDPLMICSIKTAQPE